MNFTTVDQHVHACRVEQQRAVRVKLDGGGNRMPRDAAGGWPPRHNLISRDVGQIVRESRQRGRAGTHPAR